MSSPNPETHVAFRAVDPNLSGATVCHNGKTFDVVAALDRGVVLIPTSDPQLVELLRALPALEETEVPSPPKPTPPAPKRS